MANQQLFSGDNTVQRQTQSKVRFRDHKLVDYEPVNEDMDNECHSKMINKPEDYSSDDGYIDDVTTSIEEAVEIEEFLEKVERDDRETDENENSYNEAGDSDHYPPALELDETEKEVNPACSLSSGNSINQEKAKKNSNFLPKSSKVNPSSHTQTKLRKKCCNYKGKDEFEEKLPNYNGFNSKYGLSKDEIEKRLHIQLKQNQHKELKTIHKLEQKELVASLNEEAFSKW